MLSICCEFSEQKNLSIFPIGTNVDLLPAVVTIFVIPIIIQTQIFKGPYYGH
jgi:hypothetical protein